MLKCQAEVYSHRNFWGKEVWIPAEYENMARKKLMKLEVNQAWIKYHPNSNTPAKLYRMRTEKVTQWRYAY